MGNFVPFDTHILSSLLQAKMREENNLVSTYDDPSSGFNFKLSHLRISGHGKQESAFWLGTRSLTGSEINKKAQVVTQRRSSLVQTSARSLGDRGEGNLSDWLV